MDELPKLKWIKNDPKKYKWFEDGFTFLGAIKVENQKTRKTTWEFDVVTVRCDGDWLCLEYRGGETYDAWTFEDFEYFHVLEGPMPTMEGPTE